MWVFFFFSPPGYPYSLSFSDIDDKGVDAVGVSRRSCPVCAELLGFFGKTILVQRSPHQQIYPCALPPWLPEEFVQKMVDKFWTDLEWQLTTLTKTLRRRKDPDDSDDDSD